MEQGNPVLYIEFDIEKYLLKEIECNDNTINLRKIVESHHILQIDISGRHQGDREVSNIVIELLSRFNGYALDEYSDHLWKIEEIKSGTQKYGHKFFDYKGKW